MKSLRFTITNSLIFTGLAFGLASSAFAGQAPALKPQANRGLFSYIGSGIRYSASHPFLTGSVLAGLGGIYLWQCRKYAPSCKSVLARAKEITQYLDKPFGAPKTRFMYWNLFSGSSAFISGNPRPMYTELKNQFLQNNQPESTFITDTLNKIEMDKAEISRLRYTLNSYLCAYHLTPHANAQDTNSAETVLNKYMKANNCKTPSNFSANCIEMINNEIGTLTNFSLLRPSRWAHMIAFPEETEAIEQYWKLTQMLSHLEAIQSLLIDRQKALNGEANRLSQI